MSDLVGNGDFWCSHANAPSQGGEVLPMQYTDNFLAVKIEKKLSENL